MNSLSNVLYYWWLFIIGGLVIGGPLVMKQFHASKIKAIDRRHTFIATVTSINSQKIVSCIKFASIRKHLKTLLKLTVFRHKVSEFS